MNTPTPVDALIRAASLVGGNAALAEKLTAATKARFERPISAARVWNWINRDKAAPAELCPDIEELTGVRCEELRPDANWQVLRSKPRKQKAAA